ncbi:MAG: hypothetical protein Q8O89_06135 [Nanoarchaeota archaeon]|nr:hypothetical protein [Nanoarchaeota archaeon]
MDIEHPIVEMKNELQKLLDSKFRYFNKKYDDLKVSGVYVIYDGEKIIYIGEGDNVYRRIYRDHLDEDGALINKIGWTYRLENSSARRYLIKNCKFQVLKTKFRVRLEHFAIGVINPVYNDGSKHKANDKEGAKEHDPRP